MTDETKQDSDSTVEPKDDAAVDTAAQADEHAGHDHAGHDHDHEGDEKEFEFVEDPIFDVVEKGDCAYEVKITIPPANEKKLALEVLEELQHEAQVPGFRKGRAPRKLIERKFSKVVRNDVEARLVKSAFSKLLEEKKLNPIGTPDIDGIEENTERKPEDPITCTLKFEVGPRVELGRYRGIEIERPVWKVTGEMVDKTMAQLQARYALFETLEGATAQDGDQVVISFRGTIDGEEFPGGHADNYPYIVGSKRFFPEFEKVLVGAKSGGTVSCDVTFPADYSAENLRAKTAHFEIAVNEIKRRNTPEWSGQKLAQQAGYENLADARAKTEAGIRAEMDTQSRDITEANALGVIIEASTFEMPKSLVESMANDLYEERVRELRQRHVPASQLAEAEPEMREESRHDAVESIKNWTVLNEIAEAEGIEVTDEDFAKELQNLSARTGATTEAVSQFLEEGGRRGTYERRILHAKVMGVVLEHAQITEKEGSSEEAATDDAATS